MKSKEERAKEKKKGIKEKIGEKSYQIFDRLIKGSIRYRKSVIVGTFALFAVTMMCLPFVNQEFFPNSKRPEIILDVNLPSGASIEETKRVMAGIADNLYGDKRIESFSTYVGDSAPRFILLFDPSAPEDGHGQMIIVTTGNDVRDDVRSELDQFIADKYPDAARIQGSSRPARHPITLSCSA